MPTDCRRLDDRDPSSHTRSERLDGPGSTPNSHNGDATAGRLVYVMGPSGAGKDTLIAFARARTDPARFVFAHRYITRSASAGGENHIALSVSEFAARRAAGLFALTWESHGFSYGLGVEIELWLSCGKIVVMSGARIAWTQAGQRYPDARCVFIDAPPALRMARLLARGREEEGAIKERILREVPLPDDKRIFRLDNSGSVNEAGSALLSFLEGAI